VTDASRPSGVSYTQHLRRPSGAGGRVGWVITLVGLVATVASLVAMVVGPYWWWALAVSFLGVLGYGLVFVLHDVRAWRRGVDGTPGGWT